MVLAVLQSEGVKVRVSGVRLIRSPCLPATVTVTVSVGSLSRTREYVDVPPSFMLMPVPAASFAGEMVMPVVSSSMMVKEADLTGRESAESPATSSEPSRVTVSSSSSTASFTGLNRNVALPLV